MAVATPLRGEVPATLTYPDFLERKTQLDAASGFEPLWLPDFLFPFQRALTDWAIRQGRAAVFADCGLGKTPIQLVWAENVRRKTGKPVLVITPLGVAFQTEAEAAKFGIDASVSRDGRVVSGITITNYERLHYFEREDFGGVVCDESSALKSFDGVRRAAVTDFLRKMPYRLLCTATAAPNDYIEFGTSSEALGYLGYMDMLTRFFTNTDPVGKPLFKAEGERGFLGWGRKGQWRFKGHAEEPFWKWVSSWGRALRRPSDLGFDDAGFILPALEHRQHVVTPVGDAPVVVAKGLTAERDEVRRTMPERCAVAAEMLADAPSAIAWCHLNAESEMLTKMIAGAVEVAGGEDADAKEEKLTAFTRGEIRVLVTKPSIAGWGLNWQHCNRMTFFPSHSFEQYYQAVRRCWRFGQTQPVVVDLITTEGSANALRSLERKATQSDRMFDALVRHMNDAIAVDRSTAYLKEVKVPTWLS